MRDKARSLQVDEVIFDLEDAVTADAKPVALEAVVQTLERWSGAPASVRVNPVGSPWCHAEIIELAAREKRPASLVIPKVESPRDLWFLDRLLGGVEVAVGHQTPLRVQALIESAAGIQAVREIAASSARLDALIIGYADLAASLGRPRDGAGRLELWLPAQEAVLGAARSSGIQAIDGPFMGTADDETFRAAAQRSRDLGFDGKWAIHPSQVTTLQRLFTPGGEEIARAEAVLEALAAGEAQSGAGAVALGGEMLDEASRRSALRTLARARELG
jgi:citrate lyase subunit beta/citryl-CoA lyase